MISRIKIKPTLHHKVNEMFFDSFLKIENGKKGAIIMFQKIKYKKFVFNTGKNPTCIYF